MSTVQKNNLPIVGYYNSVLVRSQFSNGAATQYERFFFKDDFPCVFISYVVVSLFFLSHRHPRRTSCICHLDPEPDKCDNPDVFQVPPLPTAVHLRCPSAQGTLYRDRDRNSKWTINEDKPLSVNQDIIGHFISALFGLIPKLQLQGRTRTCGWTNVCLCRALGDSCGCRPFHDFRYW